MSKGVRSVLLIVLWYLMTNLSPLPALPAETSVFSGRVLDREGRPVGGAEIFIYASPEVRRTADFISPKTDGDGRFTMALPGGRYWAVARVRTAGERYGPLMPGDRHSGDPLEIDLSSPLHEAAFTVADLREAALLAGRKTNAGYVRITGRILDRNGSPVPMAYAVASRAREFAAIPEYLSAWTDESGSFTLYLPRGKFFIGAAREFPAGRGSTVNAEMVLDGDRTDLDIIMETKQQE